MLFGVVAGFTSGELGKVRSSISPKEFPREHADPAASREGRREAFTGETTGQVLMQDDQVDAVSGSFWWSQRWHGKYPPGEDMHDTRDEAAALNNAEWCAAVWRSHGLSVEQALGLWACAHQTPQYYPNVVTVDLGADPSVQAKFIADLLQSHPSLDVSVKDSFASLDLRAVGMTPLFDARWLARPAQVESATAPTLQWRRIGDEPQLAAWETAWRGVHQRGARIFRRQLLSDPCAIVLGGFDEHDAIQAGGIAYDAAGALGITNVFGSGQQFIQALGSMRPGSGMVCYAAGDDLRSAVQSGFQVLGSLRIWARRT